MPGYNKTGPVGEGPMTGRGMGYCDTANPVYGRRFPNAAGFGRAIGRGRGLRRGFGLRTGGYQGRGFARRRPSDIDEYAPEDKAGKIEHLKAQAESLKNALDSINRRMEELEKTND